MSFVIIAVLVAYAVYRVYDEIVFRMEEEERADAITKNSIGRSMQEGEYTHTSIKKAPVVIHDTIYANGRVAKFYPAGTMVSIWGINQKFDGDFIGFWHVTGAKGQAIQLTNSRMSAVEVDLVALDDRALVVIGDSAEVRHYQQGHDHKCVIHGMEFTRDANVQGNFALHISNQIMFMGNLRVVGNKVVSPTGLVGTIYSNY